MLMNVVVSDAPFHVTTVDGTNPVPLMVTRRAADPTSAFAGLTPVIEGTGLFTVKLTADEVPPPGAGLCTVSFAVVPSARSVAGMVACRLDEETKVVATALPFH